MVAGAAAATALAERRAPGDVGTGGRCFYRGYLTLKCTCIFSLVLWSKLPHYQLAFTLSHTNETCPKDRDAQIPRTCILQCIIRSKL